MPDHPTTVQRFSQLLEVMHRLLGPGGCPWDREQTHQSIRGSLLEETYECIEAIDTGDLSALREELGDVLLQVVFHGVMAENAGEFTVADLIEELSEKLVRRHPHVFSEGTALHSADDVIETWDKIKATETTKAHRSSLLDGVPKALPALARALKLSKKAAKGAQFDWENAQQIWDKVKEEIGEFQAVEHEHRQGKESWDHMQDELGDILFAISNLARYYKIDPEEALQKSNSRFISRFQWMERNSPVPLSTLSPEERESLWQQAKKSLNSQS